MPEAKAKSVSTKKAPAISVIIPVLNEQSHLAAAVNSVLSQKYSGDLEVLLALGPSRDNTNQVAADLAGWAIPLVNPYRAGWAFQPLVKKHRHYGMCDEHHECQ